MKGERQRVVDRKWLFNEDENGKEVKHIFKEHSEYGTIFWEYKSGDVVILKFSMFQVSIEEKIGIAVNHLESIVCSAECSITYWKTLLCHFELDSKILKLIFLERDQIL